MPTYLDRYLAGQHEQVWSELLALGAKVRTEPLLPDALAVACETMTRTRINIERLVDRLDRIGYEFYFPCDCDDRSRQVTFRLPTTDVHEQLAKLEILAGPLPLSLYAFWEVIDSVALWGHHPDWPASMHADPLDVTPVDYALAAYDEWAECCEFDGADETGPYYIHIGADDLHKAGVSGARELGIPMPSPAADAPLLYWWQKVTFVEYLRTCFRWGGFPGFQRYENYPAKMIAYLAADLLPI